MSEVLSLRFSQTAVLLAREARRLGLAAPGFTSPPGIAGTDRTIRRRPDGSVMVAVRLRGRPFDDVVSDMVEGVLAANRLPPVLAQRHRADLRAALGDAGAWAAA